MSRYCTEVIVYNDNPEEECGSHAERVFACNITADSELAARRKVLERSWANQLLVSRFNSVQKQESKI